MIKEGFIRKDCRAPRYKDNVLV